MILMIGAGAMAQEYAKVLNGLERNYAVVGRSEASASKFKDVTGISPFVGGLNKFCETTDLTQYEFAIVTTGVEQLASTTMQLIGQGIKKILVEKPAGLDVQEIAELANYAESYNAQVYVAYNRRFSHLCLLLKTSSNKMAAFKVLISN
ncbi:Gfo/Idh/MocA family oxidoreductase [Vibrio taketomensis]|uniref:Gfo/Idh/MocA family oxidoreductase n=1 Tax=Vibrio taketomensis TaxID=2572923 RepID=UPI001E351439|nr:Gfo/Idh/MocA family oxidoreductase [Vibrio taketomensis]